MSRPGRACGPSGCGAASCCRATTLRSGNRSMTRPTRTCSVDAPALHRRAVRLSRGEVSRRQRRWPTTLWSSARRVGRHGTLCLGAPAKDSRCGARGRRKPQSGQHHPMPPNRAVLCGDVRLPTSHPAAPLRRLVRSHPRLGTGCEPRPRSDRNAPTAVRRSCAARPPRSRPPGVRMRRELCATGVEHGAVGVGGWCDAPISCARSRVLSRHGAGAADPRLPRAGRTRRCLRALHRPLGSARGGGVSGRRSRPGWRVGVVGRTLFVAAGR